MKITKQFIALSFILLLAGQLLAQKYSISGNVTDASTNESLIGVNILFKEGVGAVSDFNGDYKFSLEAGTYNVTVSYVGYDKLIKKVTVSGPTTINFTLNPTVLDEVKIVADVAIARKTPVAFSNIEPKQLQENLASQDIPMILNSTPGVYATQGGGGDGDAEVTIRGFSSRNVGVLLDGVPVNDMENGAVYWSNWFGLDVATRSIQVQRGLGASKLALPSVGGTINIITKGFDNKKGGQVKQEVGSDGYIRTTAGYNSGKLKNNWAISTAVSYKQGNGWVDRTFTKGLFYYLKIDKKIGNHLISLSGFGAPQEHGQRSYKLPIAIYNTDYARKAGIQQVYIDSVAMRYGKVDLGLRYNQHWGYLNGEKFNERINQYHKPQITLKDSWTVNDKLFISNILYMSIGRGGGIRANSTPSMDTATQKMIFQSIYDRNLVNQNDLYDTVEHVAQNFLKTQRNEHMWYGLVSTANYKLNSFVNISGGIDVRSYKGTHYTEVYDLLGADYAAPEFANYPELDYVNLENNDEAYKDFKLRVGDKNNYWNDGLVRWAGFFLLTEVELERLNAFINFTSSTTGYKRIDHFYGLNPAVKQYETGWKYIPGYTIKGGANYLLTDKINVFANLGFLNKAPRFNNVYDYSNLLWTDIINENVYAFEFGSSYKSKNFSINVNTYYTVWNNKPRDSRYPIPGDEDGETFSANIKGMNALHKGIELDFIFKITPKLDLQGMVSLGDWYWTSKDTVYIYNDNNVLQGKTFYNAKGIPVGNSAQTSLGGEIRYEPIKGLYFKVAGTFFDRYYSEFNPFKLDPDNPQKPWKVPNYCIFNAHVGYKFRIYNNSFQIRGNVLNALDAVYVSSAQNNDTYSIKPYADNDAKSATVFMGLGRRYNISLQWYF